MKKGTMAVLSDWPITFVQSAYQLVDEYERSSTLRYKPTGRCCLVIRCPGELQVIELEDFHLKRGHEPDQRPFDDRTTAILLCETLLNDEWPDADAVTDFGLETYEHLAALKYAVRNGCTTYELDRVQGDGRAITQLVSSIPKQPYNVVYHTPYKPF